MKGSVTCKHPKLNRDSMCTQDGIHGNPIPCWLFLRVDEGFRTPKGTGASRHSLKAMAQPEPPEVSQVLNVRTYRASTSQTMYWYDPSFVILGRSLPHCIFHASPLGLPDPHPLLKPSRVEDMSNLTLSTERWWRTLNMASTGLCNWAIHLIAISSGITLQVAKD
jgi:hypothetical protein